MLSSILRCPTAIQINIAITRAFVQLLQWLISNADLARKLADLEAKCDGQIGLIFDALRELMKPPESGSQGPIGYAPSPED